MERFQFDALGLVADTLNSDVPVPSFVDLEKSVAEATCISPSDEGNGGDESLFDSMVCDSGSRLVPHGLLKSSCTEDFEIFVNAGSEASTAIDAISFLADNFFTGGDTFQTEDSISDGGDYPFIYQSARLGNFFYRFENFPPGDYLIDLHFVEIINTNGPGGMRIFDVFVQDEKVLTDLDIFSVVGANKPLQLVNFRSQVKDDGLLTITFEGIIGSPLISGICIRRAHKCSAKHEYLVCKNCATEIKVSSAQKKAIQTKMKDKYEKKIQELSSECQRKTDECYQAWMSYTAANEQLEKVRMELDTKVFQIYSSDQTMEKQAERLRDISNTHNRKKKFWTLAVNELEHKLETLKKEHSQLSHEAHECANSIPDLKKMVFAIQSMVEQYEDLKLKYNEEQAKRRKLFNQVQEAKGNIRVFCRCRPPSKAETFAGHSIVVDFDTAKDGELGILSSNLSKKVFKFDRVYTPRDDQVDVFADASPMAISVLDGYNVCIFAYGQTGTGKTFTMEGTETNRGVNYRTLEELFKIVSERTETFTYSISVSVLEVYNEQIRDLLATSPSSKKLEIKQSSEGFHHVPGIVEAQVNNIKEVWSVLQAGSSARAVGSNNVNEHSSRSHCMLCIVVKARNLVNGECTQSKLWLVDLAGSERLAKTDVQGDRLKEAQNINRSLSALGDVISALASKSSHIPYRNSKLTHILQDSLGGDSKALMFVQISPSEHDLSETLSSLNFASRVRGIELGPARKQIDTSELQRVKTMLDKVKQESRCKDESIKKLEDSLQNLESKTRGKEQAHKGQQEKIKELENQLELETALRSQSDKQVLNLSESLQGKEELCSTLRQKVNELEDKLKEREQYENITYQKKAKDLENELKKQAKESESITTNLQKKIQELERKINKQEQKPELSSLRQKIEELEKKLRDQEHLERLVIDSSNPLRHTPMECKLSARHEFANEAEHHVLRSLNSVNRRASQGSNSLKGNDPLHIVRRKRLSKNSETENVNTTVPSFLHDKKNRQSDPHRPPAKTMRTVTVKAPAVVTAQEPMGRGRAGKDLVQGINNKKKIWSR